MPALDRYQADLNRLAGQSRLRSLVPREGIDFTSNDYLALATSKRLADAVTAAISAGTSIGAGGSRLLRGNAAEHEALESAAAQFFRAERTLFFASGYLANFAVLATLPQRGDLVVIDEFVHASTRDGLRAGRSPFVEARHNDAGAVDEALRAYRAQGGRGQPWIVMESLYSMDGDRAPLSDLAAIAERHDAFLVVDEAHATGVFGPDGRGLAAMLEGLGNVIVVHTCSKALGCAGALVTLPRVLADFLVNRCRPFIFGTAPSPLMAVAALEALAILKDEPERRARLAQLIGQAGRESRSKFGIPGSGSQVHPIIIGADAPTMAAAAALRAQGFDVRGIRPPTVPPGTARLRVSITLNVDAQSISGLFDLLAAELRHAPAACGNAS
ncbi:MAG TPA: 8-amino-7-oxononanoate synthase [Steroidobacteraceae bacterium]|nr:8-amino-7-oxononanoate synthase [Steroidobacteraceae bacterium]